MTNGGRGIVVVKERDRNIYIGRIFDKKLKCKSLDGKNGNPKSPR
jgi:hypothetical protein